MPLQIEHVDRVRRYWTKAELTDRQVIRLAKRLTGLTGVCCPAIRYGDMIDLRPRGIRHVVFITWADEGHERGQEVDAQGNEVG